MRFGRPAPESPARGSGGWRPEADRPDPFAAAAARALALLIAGIGAGLLVLSGLQRLLGGPLPTVASVRALMGATLVVGGVLAWTFARLGWRRLGCTAAVAIAYGAVVAQAVFSGLGTHAIGFAGGILLIALTGMLVSLPAAAVLALVNVVVAALLESAERRGQLPGAAALPQLAAETRTLAWALVTGVAFVVAVTMRHQWRGSVQHAYRAEDRMARLLQLGSDFAWELDPRGRFTWLSPSFETRTGRRVDEFLRAGEPDGPQVVPDVDWDAFLDDLRARRPFRDRIVHFRCADGTEVFLSGSGEPTFGPNGRHTGWWGVSRDGTAEMLAARTQRRSQDMLDRLVRLSPDPIIVANLRDGRILLANPAFLQLAGIATEEEAIGFNGVELGLWRDEAAMLALGEAIRGRGWVRDFRSVAWSRGGGMHAVSITAAAFDWDGAPVAVITTRDMTEMEHAKQDAEAANQAKSRFLATMSHEIRTPLSGVLGLARLLQDATLPIPQRREYLQHLVDAAEQLNGIVSDVLDLSRIEAGQVQIERIPFDLHALVRDSFRTFEPLGRERGLEMRCEIDQGAPREVVGDPGRVRQVLSNYLSNALKFTATGAIVVQLEAAASHARGARIEVHDSGIGVRPEQRALLFQPFTQGDSSTTRRFGGSGLGLSICKELATLMGGRVGHEPAVGGGSVFWVELPLEDADEEESTTISATLDEPPQPLAGMRVLLAEDNPVNRLIVGAMLNRLGASVVEAADGLQAIERATGAQPPVHAVLMDLHMPEVDGLEATRRLRAQPATATLPVIALSAAVLDAERAAAQAAGMNAFVSKPASESDLLKALWPHAPTASLPDGA